MRCNKGWSALAAVCVLLRAATAAGTDDRGDLTYAELTTLYASAVLPAELDAKLTRLLTVPLVVNRGSAAQPSIASSPKLGEYIRVLQWNIERGMRAEQIESIFASAEEFEETLDEVRFPPGSEIRRTIIDQAAALRSADVLILNEVDRGLPRTGYRDVAAELAARLGMNYAYGPEFVELSPLGLDRKKFSYETVSHADRDRYVGLHGTAILSRFPLRNVRLVPFKTQPYDWYHDEKKGVDVVEKLRRKAFKTIFAMDTEREVRRGGRNMLIAEITDPRFPAGYATIVATHLENRTPPEGRQAQLSELLETIRNVQGPVVVAGDMNTNAGDATPTSLKKEIKKRYGKPEQWLKTGLNALFGLGMIQNATMASLSFGRSHADPTVRSIPIIMPNDERKFFSMLKAFRFADGGAFDFRGSAERTSNGRKNTLANSNERNKKGFATTYRFERPMKFVGLYKLDWFFVKPVHLFDPSDYNGSYLFAPHFARTLDTINKLVPERLSDHIPMIIDLPLLEPNIPKRPAKKP